MCESSTHGPCTMPLEVSHSTAHLAQHSVVLAAAPALAAATLLTTVVVELCSGSNTSKATGLLTHCQSMCTKSTSWGHTLTYSFDAND